MTIVTLAAQPGLLPTVAGWLWQEFWRHDGYTLAETQATYAVCTALRGAPQTFVLLDGSQPVGTATLARHDLDERPDLTPWLAGVYVVPEARGRGHARRLVAAVEDACRAAAIPSAWLYTHTAEGLYARLGWRVAEVVERAGNPPVTLMWKQFAPAAPPHGIGADASTPAR